MGGFHLFTLANIPVRVSPWFFLLIIMFAQGLAPREGMLFGLCAFISVLVHEFGHALMARRFKMESGILLWGMGGVTTRQRAGTPGQEALIVAAGPGAGLLLYGLVFGITMFAPVPAGAAESIVGWLLWMNLWWSLYNLLPLIPLDGGSLMRILAIKISPKKGARFSHVFSMVVIAIIAFLCYRANWRDPFLFVMLGLFAFQNWQAMQHEGAFVRPQHDPRVRQLLMDAQAAYRAGDDAEAARLCHQLRKESNVPPIMMAQAWAILGITTTRQGQYDEAMSYLQRAPELPEVIEAKAQCLYELRQYDALEGLVGTHAFGRLPEDTRRVIVEALRDALQSRPVQT